MCIILNVHVILNTNKRIILQLGHKSLWHLLTFHNVSCKYDNKFVDQDKSK